MSAISMTNPLRALGAWSDAEPDLPFITGYDIVPSRVEGSVSVGRTLSVAETWNTVVALAAGLWQRGIGQGDTVAIQLPNWPEYLIGHLAALAVGATTVPISPILATPDVVRQLELSRAAVLIVPMSFGSHDYSGLVDSILKNLPDLKLVIAVRAPAELPQGVVRWEEVIDSGRSEASADCRRAVTTGKYLRNDDDPMLVNFTSGSTGDPKGVMHSVNSVTAHIAPLVDRLQLVPGDVFIVATSLGHAAGFMNGMYMPLLLRASVIYMDKWDPRLAMQIVEKHQVTYGPAMPTYLSDIVSHPDFERYNLTTWRAARVSGGPITRSILADMRTRLPSLGLYPGWGMTEALFLTACGPGDSVEKLLTTDGRPLGDTEISIRAGDLDGEQATGEVGEILVRSGSTMRGYFAQPELTSSSFRDGWLLTGDLGCVDSDGYLTITGRSKDIIVRGGENVPVIHVENVIAGHPAVKRVCVVGVPDSRLGEKVAAVVQTNGGPFTLDELIEFLREQNVTRQFIPEYLVIVEEFPVTSVGKPQRWKLRESALIGLGLLGA